MLTYTSTETCWRTNIIFVNQCRDLHFSHGPKHKFLFLFMQTNPLWIKKKHYSFNIKKNWKINWDVLTDFLSMGTFWPTFWTMGTFWPIYGDVLTNLGTLWLGDVLTRGSFDCNSRQEWRIDAIEELRFRSRNSNSSGSERIFFGRQASRLKAKALKEQIFTCF